MKILRNSQSIPTAIKLMAFSCVLCLSGTCCSSVYAQPGIQTDTVSRQDSTVKYLSPWEYAFMMHEETSWLFKIDFPTNIFDLNQIKIGIEKKIAPAFSLNLDIGFIQSDFFRNDSIFSSHYQFGFNVALETRWYYRMNKRVREEKVARNMSDNYLAIGFAYSHSIYTPSHYLNKKINVYAKWGFQRRFLKYGHVDFGVKAGALFLLGRDVTPIFSLNNFIDVGLAFTKDKYKLERNILCPILKCYDADKYIFKSNLNGLLGIMFTGDAFSFIIAPNIAFEHKIGKSAFSINTEFRPLLFYFFIFDNQDYGKYWETEMSLSLEGRWYYNLKHRILKGKTGNGLSANYMALGGSMKYSNGYDFSGDKLRQYLYITTGWQRLFSKHLYLDINIGIGYEFKTKNENGSVIWPFNIAVGYRF